MSKQSNNSTILIIVAIVAVVALVFLVQKNDEPDNIGEAFEQMGDNLEDAAEELDPNRTTGEKIGDAVEDAGESIENATGN